MSRESEILSRLWAEDNLRVLREGHVDGKFIEYHGHAYINMSSNDYLGLSEDVDLQKEFLIGCSRSQSYLMSNPSSRLMTGNSGDYNELEGILESLYPGKKALVLGNGYMVNTGVLPALTDSRDLVLADKYCHASLIDGMRLCGCEMQRFRHNDMDHLEAILQRSRHKYDRVWVVAESVYSMDGDRGPLAELAELKERFDLKLYLDEAHAFGVFGSGAGLAAEMGLDGQFDIIVATFGKALASFGAFVACSDMVGAVLINKMRTLIFSTALPPLVLRWTLFLLQRLATMDRRRHHLESLVSAMAPGGYATHIIPVMTPGNSSAARAAQIFRDAGFWVTPIRTPTVAAGSERVRISLTASLGTADIERFREVWKSIG